MMSPRSRQLAVAVLVFVAGSSAGRASAGPPRRGAKTRKKGSGINAYARWLPPSPARANERWVKVWYNERGWWVSWRAVNVDLGRPLGQRVLALDIKGRIDCKGDGELQEPVAVSGLTTVNKVECNGKSIYFEAPLGGLPRTLRFGSTAKSLKFTFIVDGRKSAADVLIGEDAVSPKRMPFTLKTPEIPKRQDRSRPPQRSKPAQE